MTLPSYYHLSPTQIEGLSFIITLRDDSGENEEQQFHIRWQEKLNPPSNAEPSHVSILTYTNEDVIANNQTGQGFILRSDLESYSATTRSRMDRLLREDECQTFVIAAKTRHDDDAILCVIKLYPDSGQLSSTPQFSSSEPEDFEGNVFLSDNSINKILEKGHRITTHSFSATGCVYEYTIQCSTIDEDNTNIEHMIAEQRMFDREDARREQIHDDFDSCDVLYDGSNDVFTHAAHVELVSIEGDAFVQSNLLLSSPRGSNISVQYKVVESINSADKKEERMLLEGSTTSTSCCSSVRKSLEFISNFVVSFIGVAFVLRLGYGNYGRDYSLALLFTIVPLGLIVYAAIGSEESLYHINHQFSLLFNNNSDADKPHQLVLELKVFFQNNFGFESLAGCGTVNILTEAGTYDLNVPTWKPMACPGISETEGRMYDYFLGSSCEVGPQDPMPSKSEFELSKDTDIQLLSKAGLHTKSTGTVRLQVNISPNFFKDKIKAEIVDNHHHRVKMRETVDEVLTRVRLNKIERVRRSRTSLP